MATEPRPASQEANPGYCNWHPETETRLYCSHCGKSICTLCLVQAPVGIRCRECGRPEKLPTYDVQRSYYARAIGVGVAIAIVGGVLWGILHNQLGMLPFVGWLLGIGAGYAGGELISRSVNRKRGVTLAWIAGVAVGMAGVVHFFFIPLLGGFSIVVNLLILALAVFIAASRVR